MLTVHIHVDESGDLNFSPAGSRYYIFTAAWTYDPAPLANDLNCLRFKFIKDGHGEGLSSFHARQDAEPKRNEVIKVLLEHSSWQFASIVVEKRCVNLSIREPDKFYPKFLTMVLRFIFRGRLIRRTAKVLVYTDTLPFTGKQARAVGSTIKAACRSDLPSGIPFHVLHHRRETNAWLQVADYCSWSVFRKWEHGIVGEYDRIKARIAAREIAPMSHGDGRIYY